MNQPASAHPVIEPLHAGDYAAPRSDTSKVPKQAVHQTVYTADHYTEADYLSAENGMLYNAADGANTPLSPALLPRPEGEKINWLHFVGINDADLLKAALSPYHIHELVLEDILSRKQRPKIEDYDSYLFIAARVYQYVDNKLQADQVYLIVGSNFVLTFQQRPLGLFSKIRAHMRHERYDVRSQDAAFLAYRIVDRLVDDYFLTLDQYNNRVEFIDKTLFADSADGTANCGRVGSRRPYHGSPSGN